MSFCPIQNSLADDMQVHIFYWSIWWRIRCIVVYLRHKHLHFNLYFSVTIW